MKEAEDENNKLDDLNDIKTNIISNKENEKKKIMKCNKEFLTFDKKNYPPILQNFIPRNNGKQLLKMEIM